MPPTAQLHAQRRARLLERLRAADGALVVPAAPELRVGADGELRYMPDSDLYYLTGYVEPEAVLVLAPGADAEFTLFVRERDTERETWTGRRGGVEAARDVFGADAAHPLGELARRLPKLVAAASLLYAPLRTGRPEFDAALLHVLAVARRERPRTGRGAIGVMQPHALIAPMRLIKDEHEIALMREAARITVAAFETAAQSVPAADGEWHVEAALEHAFRAAGAMGPAFPSIVAGGANATVLHYISNDAALRRDDLLLIDAGARYAMYCADVTRCYPAGGRFTDRQRDVYDIVLRAHDAAIAAVRPGARHAQVEDAALAVLADGMIETGLLDGTIEAVLEGREYRRFFPHRVTHWLGLDVHDVGDYVAQGDSVVLQAGMVLTVEPGLYIAADDDGAPDALRGTGVRLEDDVLVTADGCEVLTAGLASRADEVEALMSGG
jgi:Xaa-Pro aminopeptidase